MLFSLNKLKQLANLPKEISTEDITNAINSIGFEVEEIKLFSDVKGIKFAKVVETYKNPNGEKLTVCRLQFDDKERIIQTTATNVEVGNVVIAFVPGSSVNGFTFEAKELKGIVSEGMLTAPSEFGIAEDLVRKEHTLGIMNYPEITNLSIDPVEYLGLNDFIIDVKILSNRADANSYFAFALELAAYFKTSVDFPVRRKPTFETDIKVEKSIEKSLALVEAKKDFTISIQDQILLAKSGVKSINDIADLTNLALLMTGQPTHAYDKNVVGKNFKAELKSGNVKIFGGKDVELENNLVITSDNEIVSVAGVIGIEHKGVTSGTQNFILEFGRFNIKDVRKAAKVVKLNTSASNQSSKEFNSTMTRWAIDYVSTIVSTLSNVINEPMFEQKSIPYSAEKISFLANKDITNEKTYLEAIKSLEIIGYEFSEKSVKVAPHISGIETQQDLNEEVFRFYGYDSFKPAAPTIMPSNVQTVKSLHKQVAAQGFQEVVTYSLVSQSKNLFNPFGFKETIKLETFVSKEREEIRNSFASSLLEVVLYNQKRKMNNISIFDIGMINNGYKTLALASTTKTFAEMAKDIKNIIGEDITFERFDASDVHQGVSAKIMHQEKMIGWIGKLHPSLDETNAFVAEVIILPNDKKITFAEYSSEPMKQRDVTIGINIKEDMKSVLDKLKKFDVFAVEFITKFEKENKNNVTFRITAPEATINLIDKEFN